ncbi:putative histone deacetylase [Zopfia rhizophila CBS 207.26]|uniref:histone deacetylase n=1 Tax=Zopfia rhizophila CBS 207.26 TaxID=1314779 RepID=A0A6A6DM61_9PEZI|nr:putative histone deacetylase [Zopfia rhizophila CBS 207.26]
MEDEDYPMAEGSVVDTTEVNGNHNTVDPSMIAMHDGSLRAPFPARKEQLPILSHGEPSLASPELSLSNEAQKFQFAEPITSIDNSAGSTPESESDAMDLTSPPSTSVQVKIPPPPPKFAPLPYSSSKTGLVYDPRMRFHTEPLTLMIKVDDIHPEDPRRIHEIFQEIQQAGLVQGPEESDNDAKEFQCYRIHARHATKEEICLIHTPEHFKRTGHGILTLNVELPEARLNELANERDSIYFHNSTFECATLAAGGAIEACRAVVRGDVRNAIAIIRPPGHHAECDSPSGFCIFNNVPIATRVCQDNFSQKCRKVLVLDWDVHHGNGVQHAFYQDPNVLYISIHVYKNATFYPNMKDANYDFCGEGPGLGKNVNIPWADHGMGDAEYIHAFQEVVMPIATEFDPDLVIVSAGFDAAEGDALGGCHVTPACYAHMTHMLMGLAKGKIAVCLEGGYNLRSIARSALAVTRTLMLEAPDRLADDLHPKPSAVQTIQRVKREQSRYWKCMYPKEIDKNDASYLATQRLHDIIREWQSKALRDEHYMTPLTIQKPLIAQSFEHNVIATPRFMEARPLLVIFHDPPDVMNKSDPTTGKQELHNTWLTDVTKSYIDWAVKNGFEVIDVNIPRVIAIEDDEGGYIKADNTEVRAGQTRELASYLWENYIEPNDATQVFLMGVGAAYLGLVDLLSNHESCTEPDSPIECLIGFVSETSIQSIKRATDDNIAMWYHEHSRIFVANSHHVWDPNRVRKIRKKYGKLKQSKYDALADMLVAHRDEVTAILLERKDKYEGTDTESRVAEVIQQGLRSPPLPSGTSTPVTRTNNTDNRPAAPHAAVRSPKMPPVGFFTVSNSPRSPHSPMKRTF